jgi:transposase
METKKGGLKTGLYFKPRLAPLMLDETIITETPPLNAGWALKGHPVEVPISGNRRKRILHGALNIRSGDVLLFITNEWDQETHKAFLHMIRTHWRGWNIVVFEDKGTPHTATSSRELAQRLKMKIRFLPTATPELNAMDHIWRHAKRNALSNRSTQTITRSIMEASRFILRLSKKQRLQKAGVLSNHFWLKRWPK